MRRRRRWGARSRSGGQAAELQFEQTDDPYQWVLPTGKLELVHIEGIYVATVQFTGRRWVVIDDDCRTRRESVGPTAARADNVSGRNLLARPGCPRTAGSSLRCPQRAFGVRAGAAQGQDQWPALAAGPPTARTTRWTCATRRPTARRAWLRAWRSKRAERRPAARSGACRLPRLCDSQRAENRARGGGAVERDEVDAGHALAQQLRALQRGVGDAEVEGVVEEQLCD